MPNHDIFWFWSLEERYAKAMFNISQEQLLQTFLWDFCVDFYVQYDEFKNNFLNIKTLPDLDKDKFNEYMYTYSDRLGYSISI